MSTLIKQVRHFTKKTCSKRVRGDFVYILGLLIFLCLVLVFRGVLNRERLNITYEMLDDSLMESMVSACVCNVQEYGISGQSVIYRTLTPIKLPSVFDDMEAAEGVEEEEEYKPLDDPEIFMPGTDAYLNGCYERFLNNLRHNMKLTSAMEATVSGIEGVVTISNFTVYNKYREFNDSGAEVGYRIIAYTRQSSGMWTVTDYGKNHPVTVYNSLDKTNTNITETSIAVCLSFDVKLGETSGSWMPNLPESDKKQSVSYQRIVDVRAY